MTRLKNGSEHRRTTNWIPSRWCSGLAVKMNLAIQPRLVFFAGKNVHLYHSVYYESSTKRSESDIARVNEATHSFTCHLLAHPQMEWAIPSCRATPPFGRYSIPIPLRIGGGVGLCGFVMTPRWYAKKTVTHPSTNRARRRVTSLMETIVFQFYSYSYSYSSNMRTCTRVYIH